MPEVWETMTVKMIKSNLSATSKMAWWIRVLTSKPGELSSIPRTHMKKVALTTILFKSSSYLNTNCGLYTGTHTHKGNVIECVKRQFSIILLCCLWISVINLSLFTHLHFLISWKFRVLYKVIILNKKKTSLDEHT